jgi:hypothetical protein
MNQLQVLLLALTVALSQSVSFKVAGKYLVTVVAAPGTTPHHLSFNEARNAIKQVVSGKTGTIQVGSVDLTVAPISA